MSEAKGFNIRVYGLLVDDGKILVSDEFRLGQRMTKFPGGGLELGEGTKDCLRREFMEELGQPVKRLRHFYTTDFYQLSRLLKPPMQIISIYYQVAVELPYRFKTSNEKFDIDNKDGSQAFRWCELQRMASTDLTMPIDRVVLQKLQEQVRQS